mmetsp:Transcript_31176/g.48808  ORF Transcript_31176/g.48808 Transcript_31176/m.48808 type:complete len:101 (-) Transcript_31176:296-598(-)
MNRHGMVPWTNILLLVANTNQMHRLRMRSDLSIALPGLDGVLRSKMSHSNLAQRSARSNRSSRRALQVKLVESTAWLLRMNSLIVGGRIISAIQKMLANR